MVHPTLLGCLACWISPVIVTDAFKLPMFRERRGGGGQEEREPRQPSSSTTTGTTTSSTRILATMADAFEKSSVNAILNNMAGDGAGSIAGDASSSSSSSLPSLPPFLYFHQHVTPMVSTFLHRFYEHMLAVLLYKPPVGFVMLVTATRLVTSGRLFRLYEAPSSVEDQAQLQRRRRRDLDRPTRALTLDPQDTAYQTAGGVDPIRQKLCLAALSGSRTEHDRKENEPRSPAGAATSAAATLSNKTKSNNDTIDSDNSHHYELLDRALRQALQIQCRSSRMAFLHEMGSKIALLDAASECAAVAAAAAAQQPEESLSSSSSFKRATTKQVTPSYFSKKNVVVDQAVQVCQMRVADALLRVARDRLLLTTHRLGKTVSYWEKQVQQVPLRYRILSWQSWRVGGGGNVAAGSSSSSSSSSSSRMEQDRLRLAYASAAYQHEIRQLGIILQLLLSRPPDLPASLLLQASKETKQEQALLAETNAAAAAAAASQSNDEKEKKKKNNIIDMSSSPPSSAAAAITTNNSTRSRLLKFKKRFWDPNAISSVLSKYYLRWQADGTSLLSVVRKWEGVQQALDPTVATRLLVHENDQTGWTKAAQEWTMLSRQSLCRIIRESLDGGNIPTTHKPGQQHSLSVQDFEQASQNLVSGLGTSEAEWTRFLVYVDYLSQWRRVGEGQTIRIADAVLNKWTRSADIMGVPSTLLKIKIAEWIHKAVLPHWPEFRQNALIVVQTLLEILQQRVWVPLRGIWSELMNKSNGIMSGFGLQLEEQSLDNMLRDLGYGDGTPANRLLALQKAAEQYESQLSGGVFVNIARGGLVRLLLVQVQQLKVGLLSALDTIDVLLKGNQIHFQLLAAIPAVIFATYGTRFVLRFIYSIRAKDLRPITAAHSKMAGYLSHIERVILLDEPDKSIDATQKQQQQQQHHHLSPATLGEVALYMYRYLSLLEYSSTLLPGSSTEQIHLSLQELLGTTSRNDGSNDLTIRWLDRIKGQHQELLKHF